MAWSRTSLVAVVALAQAAFACSSSSDTPATPVDTGPPPVTVNQACAEFIKSQCDKINSCAPFFLQVSYGDAAKCNERFKLLCANVFAAPNTSLTPARGLECATSIAGTACLDVISDNPPKACIPNPGKVADGGACGDNWQCTSTWCAKPSGSHCGKCTALPTAGGACVENNCGGRGLVCANKVCAKAGTVGNACSDTQPCAASLACFSGKCTAGVAAGAKCDPAGTTNPPCDLTQGTVCNGMTKVCQKILLAKSGESCGLVGGDYKVCSAGAKCVGAMGTTPGTCIAPAVDGGACDTTKGPGCLEPASCIDKVCKLPDSAACK